MIEARGESSKCRVIRRKKETARVDNKHSGMEKKTIHEYLISPRENSLIHQWLYSPLLGPDHFFSFIT
jgi:hypothetical protein